MMLLTGQPRLAERDAAIHAARALLRRLVVVEREDELAVVAHALRRPAASTSWIRCSSRKPVILPIVVLLRRPRASCASTPAGFGAAAFAYISRQRAPVLVREHLDEFRARRVPVVEDRQRAACCR